MDVALPHVNKTFMELDYIQSRQQPGGNTDFL